MRRRGFLGLALAGLLGASCGPRPGGQGGGRAPAAPSENVLLVGKADDPVGLDPAALTDLESIQVTESIYDTLVRFGEGTLDVEPALAESWTSSPDGRTWTFRLRDGVRFHDGEPCDAGAVAWNYARQIDPSSPSRYGATFSYWALIWGTPSKLTRVEAVDRRTVRFELSEPVAPFLDSMALSYFGLSSPAAVERHREDYFKHPVGTGPFRFVEWAPQERVVLERFDRHWDGAPALDRVVFRPIPDANSRQMQLRAGAVHLVTQVILETVEDLAQDPSVRVVSEPGMNVGFLAFNNRRLEDRRVRQALRCAVDMPALVEGLFRSLATPASSPLPPPVWGRLDRGPERYDPDRARRLLAEAGYADGLSLDLWYMSVSRPYMPEPRAIGEALQAMLAEVGVTVDLKTSDWSQYLDSTAKGEFDLCLLGWVGDHGDPDNYLFTLFDSQNIDTEVGGSNLFLYRNEEVDGLLRRARTLLKRPEREPLYLRAQEILWEDAPWAPMAYADQVAAHHPALEGFRLHPGGMLRLNRARWKR